MGSERCSACLAMDVEMYGCCRMHLAWSRLVAVQIIDKMLFLPMVGDTESGRGGVVLVCGMQLGRRRCCVLGAMHRYLCA